MTPRAVLARLPGWEGAGWRALDGGQTNHAWLVEKNGRKAVLKIDAAPRETPLNKRQFEAAIQSTAAENGLAGKVLVATDTVYLTEYLEGRVLAPADLLDESLLQRLGRALRRLHALPGSGRRFDAVGAARQYAASIHTADGNAVQRHLRIIESMPGNSRPRCCHNDLVAENIVATPDIRFIDWEYACDNDPLFDLATVVAHHALSDELAVCLLNAYFDGDGARHREQLAEFERVYSSLLWLWQAARVPGSGKR